MAGRGRDAQTLGPARDGRIVDRLYIDAVFVEQQVARSLALLRICHHHRDDVCLAGHDRQASGIEHRLDPRRALLMAVALELALFQIADASESAGGDDVVKMEPDAWLRRKSISAAEPAT